MSNIEHIAHELEDRIMDCWNVTSDIKLTYEEYLDSPESMSEDELSNILIGIESLYNRKFQRLWQTFEEVCDHGGIWLDKDLVESANQHKDLVKVRNVPDRLYNDVAEKRWDFSPDEDDEDDEDGEIIKYTTTWDKKDNLSKYLLNISGYTQEMVDEIMETGVLTPVDDVKHTKEYYDTERNKAPDIQNMSPDIINMSSDSLSDGLSNRSMKQKHGRAVQTTSEMMQEELEPLPINTFE